MHQRLVKSILGEQVYERLAKAITRAQTSSVIDISELHDAFNIAPKSVVAWLMANVAPMKEGEAKEIKAPWAENATVLVNKNGQDVYSGAFNKDGKAQHEFRLCSIPQLAAHILSFFELYDEALADHKEDKEDKKEDVVEQDKQQDTQAKIESKEEQFKSNVKFNADEIVVLREKLAALDAKINTLIIMVTNNLQKTEHTKPKKVSNAIASIKKLIGQLNKSNAMPKPPRPGTNVGRGKGITQAGIHGEKTPHSDFNPRGGQTQTSLSPYLKTGQKLSEQFGLPKQPQPPKAPKLQLALKSESSAVKCPDCGQHLFKNQTFQKCACFFVLSNPKTHIQNNVITLEFKNDWTEEDRLALWHSWARGKKK